MSEKITVTGCLEKISGTKDGKIWTIYEITTDDLRKLDCFEKLEVDKEYEGEVKENPNPAYNARFNLKKEGVGKKGFTKNYDFEKRRVALECTIALIAAGKIPIENLIECRNKFFEYLNS